MNKPMIGQSVYYKSRGSADGKFPSTNRAAIITDLREQAIEENPSTVVHYQVRLCVMNPEGLFFTDWLDKGQAGGQWDYAYNSGMTSGN